MCVCVCKTSVFVCVSVDVSVCACVHVFVYMYVVHLSFFVHFDALGIHADAFVCILLRELYLAPKQYFEPMLQVQFIVFRRPKAIIEKKRTLTAHTLLYPPILDLG